MKDCVFCKIAAKTLPANIVYESDRVIAFLDINPVSKGHTLVIPKDHVTDFSELVTNSSVDVGKFFKEVENVRKVIKGKYRPKGIRIDINTDGLIEVPHLHVHLVPVY